jgi:hypothetical protein
MDLTDIVIIIVIILVAILICYNFICQKDHMINLDDSRKKELTKCCIETKCYAKPDFLREKCEENKIEAKKELDKSFEPVYTQEEYYKKLNNLDIIKTQDMPNIEKDQQFINKLNERINVIDTMTFDKIVNDDTNMIVGYNKSEYASFNKIV